MQVAQFVRKYTISSSGKKVVRRGNIDSTVKWVEYATDLIDMTELLKTASFEEKCNLSTAMLVAERKKNWHYKQENFDLKRASYLLSCWQKATKQYPEG
jgi:hypothetical protein